MRLPGARCKCRLDTNTWDRQAYCWGVTESEVRRSRKLNSFPLPLALLADVLKHSPRLSLSLRLCRTNPRFAARMNNAVDAQTRPLTGLSQPLSSFCFLFLSLSLCHAHTHTHTHTRSPVDQRKFPPTLSTRLLVWASMTLRWKGWKGGRRRQREREWERMVS